MPDTDTDRIRHAWEMDGTITRLGMRPDADKAVQAALIPPGGDWQCTAVPGAVTRSIEWQQTEIALVNPRGDLSDGLEGEIAMGIRATPVMDRALRVIGILAGDATNLELIAKISRAAIDYVEHPAPPIPDPDEDDDEHA